MLTGVTWLLEATTGVAAVQARRRLLPAPSSSTMTTDITRRGTRSSRRQ